MSPRRYVKRPGLSTEVIRLVTGRAGKRRPVALVGMGGSGKSALAADVCGAGRVRRRFPDGVIRLEVRPEQDPVTLLADIGRRSGLAATGRGFATLARGRDTLAAAFRGKRLLIALDGVRDRGPLDAVEVLPDTCRVLFTTRLSGLAEAMDAAEVRVGELTRDQALRLLGAWTREPVGELPPEAHRLCARVGNLALGVAITGAMVARGHSYTDVLALIERDPARIRAELDPRYHHDALFAAVGASVDELPAPDRAGYAQLAVFAGRGPFPREAVQAVWGAEMSGPRTGELLAGLVGRSLLSSPEDGWYVAHRLQYDVMARRLTPDGLVAAHNRLLDGYRETYPDGWTGSAADRYLGSALAGHLAAAGRHDELHALLADVPWIRARLRHGVLPELVSDYRYAHDTLSPHIVRALRLSAPVVTADPDRVRVQLTNRLHGHRDPAVAAWTVRNASDDLPGPWLTAPGPVLTPTTGALEGVLTDHGGRAVPSVAVTPDGSRVVSGGGDGTIRIWDLDTGRQRAALTGHTGTVSSVAVTPDGSRVVSGGGDGTIRIWDLETGRQRAMRADHGGWVYSVAVTPDGSRVVSGGHGPIWVWDLRSGRRRAMRADHGGWAVPSVAVTPDGSRVVSSGGDGTIRIWDLRSGRQRAVLTGHTDAVAVAVTPDGRRAISTGGDRTVRVWDLDTGRQQAALTGHTGWVGPVAVTPDGRLAVSGGGDRTVRVWDLDTGRQRATLTGHTGEVCSVTVTPDGRRAISGGSDGTIRVWNLGTRQRRTVSTGHTGRVYSVAVTPDGNRAISGGDDGTIRIWDLDTRRQRAVLTDRVGWVHTVTVTPDGNRVVSGDGGTVRVWDLDTGRQRATLTGHTGWVHAVAVTPDGRRAISGGETVRVWDLDTGRQRAALTGHTSGVFAVAVTPDGRRVVVGGHGPIWVWELDTGRQRATLTGHTGAVHAMTVTPDGRRAISGGDDGTVRVWDLDTGRQRATLTGHTGAVHAVTVTPDGRRAISGGDDGTVRVWDLDTGRQAADWAGEYPVVACGVVAGGTLKVVVGQRIGPPYLLELHDARTGGGGESDGRELRRTTE
ncbi:hypothetical protein GCM10010517_51920 [Streptosporangium fragile]|uniref:Uncharacterized protein n=1 Tax=Streptosporangium fragile TaxID=46186 RepID=A0ABP6IIP3_9ACTN